MGSFANCDELLLLGTSTIKEWTQYGEGGEAAEKSSSAIVFACFISVM